MLTSPLSPNHGRQQEKQIRRDDPKPSKGGSSSEVILILGEPTSEDLFALLRWGSKPLRSHRRRLLIFASDIRGLPQSAFQTPYVDIHILSNSLREVSGPNSQCPNRDPGEAIHLVDVLESASQFAAAWRADAEWFIRRDQLTKGGPQFSSSRDRAHSSNLSDGTYAIDSSKSTRTTPATLNDVNDDIHPKLNNSRDHCYTKSNSNSKSTANSTAPTSIHFSSPSVPWHPSIYQQNANLCPRSQGDNQVSHLEAYPRTFDKVLNFLSADLTEKSLLKQVILLSTLCGQYFARSKAEIPRLNPSRAFGSRTSHASSSRSPSYSQNFKEKPHALFSRTPTTKSKAEGARRTSTASSSAPGSASPARSPTSSETSRSTALSDTQPRRWSMLSWLSTTSASQASDTGPGVNTKVGTTIELRRRLSILFGRSPKRPESALNLPPQGVTEGGQSGCKRRRTKLGQVQQISRQHAYLVHVLPTSWSPGSLPAGPPAGTASQKRKNQTFDEPDLRNSVRSPSPSSGALDGTTGSFTHARMQTSLMRRATLQQMRLHNLERRYSMPAFCVERAASQTTLDPMLSAGPLTRNPGQVQKRAKPSLADHLEEFLYDYFGQGNGDVLPFVLDVGVFGREVSVNFGKGGLKKRMLVGEAVLSGLLDEFPMNRQCWVGDEDLVVKSLSMRPDHPPPAAISPSSSEGSEVAGPAGASPCRSRARPDFESPMLTPERHGIPLPGGMNTLKAPEPAHIYPPSPKFYASKRLDKKQ